MNTYFKRLANEGVTEEDATEDMTSVPQYDGCNDTEQPSQSGSDSQPFSDTASTSRFGTANTEGTMEDHGNGLNGPGTAEPSPSASQASVSADEEVAENDEIWADALLTNILKGTDELVVVFRRRLDSTAGAHGVLACIFGVGFLLLDHFSSGQHRVVPQIDFLILLIPMCPRDVHFSVTGRALSARV